MSASSCWQCAQFVISVCLLLRTNSAFVVRRRYLASEVFLWSSSLKNLNKASLLAVSLRNYRHSDPFGRGIWVVTFVRRPAVSPRLVHVCDLRLEIWYVSHTASTCVQHTVNWLSKNGNNCICVYSPKNDVWLGSDLFSDDTRPSGHICRPTQVDVSQSCSHSPNKLLNYIAQVWGVGGSWS